MLDEAIRNRVNAVLAPLRVVYGAMVGSILVYWVVVQVIRKVGQIPRGRDTFAAVDWMRYPLYVLGIAACVGILLMRRRLFDPARPHPSRSWTLPAGGALRPLLESDPGLCGGGNPGDPGSGAVLRRRLPARISTRWPACRSWRLRWPFRPRGNGRTALTRIRASRPELFSTRDS